MPDLAQARLSFAIWLLASAAACLLTRPVWPRVRRWLEPRPFTATPWDGGGVYVIVAGYLLLPGLVAQLLAYLGFFEDTSPGMQLRAGPWLMLGTLPLFVALVVLLCWLAGASAAARLGLSRATLGPNLGLGLLAALVFTPLANALHALVSWLMLAWFYAAPEAHPLMRLALHELPRLEWVALVASAILAVPVLEELLFRGVLQRWLSAKAWGGAVAWAVALVCASLGRREALLTGWAASSWGGLLAESAPLLFILALAPGLLFLQWRAATPAPAAVYGSAALFAAIHSGVWPSPIPLFALGLGLGFLAQRTQSIVAPLVVHMVFNAVACLVLVLTLR